MYGPHWQGRTLAPDLPNFRRDGSTAGLDGRSHVGSGKVEAEDVRGYYSFVRSMVGDAYFVLHYRSGVGNPLTQDLDGFKLTASDLTALYNRWFLEKFIKTPPKRVVEIGGGFGALAAHMRELWPEAAITIVDLPEHKTFQEYYLMSTVGMDGIEIVTMPPQEDADLVVALRCMMEMPPSEVHKYLEWIQLQPPGTRFYLVNRYFKWNVLKEYPFDENWAIEYSQVCVPNPRSHELLLRRTGEVNPTFCEFLDMLPPYYLGPKKVQADLTWDIAGPLKRKKT